MVRLRGAERYGRYGRYDAWVYSKPVLEAMSQVVDSAKLQATPVEQIILPSYYDELTHNENKGKPIGAVLHALLEKS